MSESAIALATLFTVSMMGLGFVLFLKGLREPFDRNTDHRLDWRRRRG